MAATAPRLSRSGYGEAACEQTKDRAVRTGRGQPDANADRAFDHARRDLDQSQT
jgi:hypothetical protein